MSTGCSENKAKTEIKRVRLGEKTPSTQAFCSSVRTGCEIFCAFLGEHDDVTIKLTFDLLI